MWGEGKKRTVCQTRKLSRAAIWGDLEAERVFCLWKVRPQRFL